jgi:hypothetical protein
MHILHIYLDSKFNFDIVHNFGFGSGLGGIMECSLRIVNIGINVAHHLMNISYISGN